MVHGHAQKFELNKISHANFIEFKYDRIYPQNEWAFEKQTNYVFYLHSAKSNLKVIFFTLYLESKKKLFHIWNLHKI